MCENAPDSNPRSEEAPQSFPELEELSRDIQKQIRDNRQFLETLWEDET